MDNTIKTTIHNIIKKIWDEEKKKKKKSYVNYKTKKGLILISTLIR